MERAERNEAAPDVGPDRGGGHYMERTMKTTISPLLISLLGACMLALGACSDFTGPNTSHQTDSSVCSTPDSASVRSPSCPR